MNQTQHHWHAQQDYYYPCVSIIIQIWLNFTVGISKLTSLTWYNEVIIVEQVRINANTTCIVMTLFTMTFWLTLVVR